MASYQVSNQSELMSALSSAVGGDTIVLQDGNYGSLDIVGQSYSQYVTIESQDPGGAKFTSITVSDSEYVRIDGVHVDSQSNGGPSSKVVEVINGSQHIEFINSEVNGSVDGVYTGHYGIFSDNSTDVTFANNYVHDVKNGGVFFTTNDLVVSGNTFDYIGEDSMKFAGVHGALIENNFGAQFYFPEPGAHLDFIQFQGGSSSDIVIRGNVQLPGNSAATYVQGILLDTPSHTNVLIEQNIIVTGMIHGVTATNPDNIGLTIIDNTLLNLPGGVHSATQVSPGGQGLVVAGNINGVNIGHPLYGQGVNIGVQHQDANAALYYGDLFEGTVGIGMTIDDLAPVAGGLAETFGANIRLAELLGGTVPDPTPAPEPIPDPEPDPVPDPAPQSGPAEDVDGLLYMIPGTRTINGSEDVLEFAHAEQLAVPAATISLSFSAETTSGRSGILSKDASGNGHHFAVYLDNGSLIVRFQDYTQEKYIHVGGIQANTDYDLQISFGSGQAVVFLDGVQVGSADIGTNWEYNAEYLQVGANGWGSTPGQAGFTDVFSGTISDVSIAAGVLTPTEMDAILQAAGAGTNTVPPPGPVDDQDGIAPSGVANPTQTSSLPDGTTGATPQAQDDQDSPNPEPVVVVEVYSDMDTFVFSDGWSAASMSGAGSSSAGMADPGSAGAQHDVDALNRDQMDLAEPIAAAPLTSGSGQSAHDGSYSETVFTELDDLNGHESAAAFTGFAHYDDLFF